MLIWLAIDTQFAVLNSHALTAFGKILYSQKSKMATNNTTTNNEVDPKCQKYDVVYQNLHFQSHGIQR